MVWDINVKLTDLAIIFATMLGPILAVQAQKLLEHRRVIKERRLAIFRILMANRASPLSPEYVQAFNSIPVEFYGTKGKLKQINNAWKSVLSHHFVDGSTAELWNQKRTELLTKLLLEMSQFLNYDFSQDQIERDIYSPRAYSELENEQTIIRKGFVKLFNGDAVLPMAVKEFPATADDSTLANQVALQKLLLEWLQGQRAVKVERDMVNADQV